MMALSKFIADLADMFEVAHAAGRGLTIPSDLVGLFGPALRDAMDAAHALERRARLANELEEYARELDPHSLFNRAADFVDPHVGEAQVITFPGPRGEQ